jgi:hypothetical protein
MICFVAASHVLTAAHCVDGFVIYEIIIGATKADWYGGDADADIVIVESSSAVKHEDYDVSNLFM